MFVSVEDNAGTGSEPFPVELLGPKKEYVTLSKELYALLVAYYNNAYNYNFTFLTDILEHLDAIAILPGITIYERIKIGDEIFGPCSILFREYNKSTGRSKEACTCLCMVTNIIDLIDLPGIYIDLSYRHIGLLVFL
ncbi:509_t:CDS:2 [Gigaspora rosea]|nr:509_t:CDS:2 [Gigaspora rosea]